MNFREIDLPAEENRLGKVGKLEDGRTCVKFERSFAHPIDKVWAAITEAKAREAWFPGFQCELREGGRFEIWFGGECEGPAHVEGKVTRYEPTNVFECGSTRWELEPTSAGCTMAFTDILHFDGVRSDTDFANSVLGGWHAYMDLLENALDGKSYDPDTPEPDYGPVDIPGRP
jgi:uncharacterized protein YndB with AHSA1/START domain